MGEGVKIDQWGYEVRTSSDACISAINDFYHQVLSYGRDRSVILKAQEHDKDCVLANILAAHFIFSSDRARGSSCIEAAKSHLEEATFYEKAVFNVVSYLMSADRDDDVAVNLHSKHLKEFPRDLASLKRAQVLCFVMGRPDLSLVLVEQVLPENEGENYIYGMHAFPLLELGRLREAKEAAKKGYEINKQDSWSQHAFCHVLQYECHFKEAVEFMKECSPSWGPCSSFMLTHNWWHVALCYLEGHAPIQRIVEVYDHYIWKELEKSDASSAEVCLNAAGLLLRVNLRGKLDLFGDRLKILADSLADEANWYVEWHLDVLAMWTLASAGEILKGEDLLNGLKSRFFMMSKKKQGLMYKGLLLAEALFEFGKGNYHRALQLLGAEFNAYDFKMIGVSDEQADVFNEVYYILLLNTGQAMKAIEVIEKRLQKWEGIPFFWRLLERAYKLANKPEASAACEKARSLENSYFN